MAKVKKEKATTVTVAPSNKIKKCIKIQFFCISIFILTIIIALIWGGCFGFDVEIPALGIDRITGWEAIYSAFVIEVIFMWPVYFAAIALLIITSIIRIVDYIKHKKNPAQPKRITDIYKGYKK